MRYQVPFLLTALQQYRPVLGQNPSLPDEFIRCTGELLEVGLTIGIAFCDRPAWVP